MIVFSSHGNLVVDPTTGKVDRTKSEYDGDELRSIERFDIEEFCMFWGCEPQNADILDLGYWDSDGAYEPASMDWRWEVAVDFLFEDIFDEVPESASLAELHAQVWEGIAFGAMSKI